MELKTVLVTQARCGSTRLPRKILKEVNGKTLLEIHLDRLSKCSFVSEMIVATTKNPDDYISENLTYVIGCFTGVINNRKAEIRTIDDKEDYERSIKYYMKDGGILRLNNICARTYYYKEPGGIQTNRKKILSKKNSQYLMKKYPDFVKLNKSRKSGFVEIRLRHNKN